jgi:hemolysin type calcium-binding protein
MANRKRLTQSRMSAQHSSKKHRTAFRSFTAWTTDSFDRRVRRTQTFGLRGLVVVVCVLAWSGSSADPALAITYPVTSTGDSGAGSLRDAITSANATPGLDTIDFAIGTGAQTISPTSVLPTITDTVNIDGTSQPGFAGTPLVRLDGASAGSGATGLLVTGGSSTVRGLEITGWSNRGIELRGGGSNLIAGNYIGTDGANALANVNAGVIVDVASTNNTIGGTVAGDRNVLSGNGRGVVVAGIGTNGNVVEGNYIGTNAAGTAAIANGTDGVLVVNGATGNTVGGTIPGSGNVSSGNGQAGVDVTASSSNTIEGNYIGTNAAGSGAVGNLKGVGLGDGSPNNIVGGTTPGARNVISGNVNRGVVIGASGSNGNLLEGNYIGTNATGRGALPNGLGGVLVFNNAIGNVTGGTIPGAGNTIAFNAGAGKTSGSLVGGVGVQVDGGSSTRNAILSNSIYANSGKVGIILSTGGNASQPAPTVSSVTTGRRSTVVSGTVAAGTTRVEAFVSPTCGDPEGKRFLGSREVSNGHWSLNVAKLGSGQGVTATATRTSTSNTSQFSSCRTVPGASRCAREVATIVGSNAKDRLKGTRKRDVIAALAGNDTVRGLRGNDIICGGKGRDKLLGGPGRDKLLGGPGRDKLLGGPGRDKQSQ